MTVQPDDSIVRYVQHSVVSEICRREHIDKEELLKLKATKLIAKAEATSVRAVRGFLRRINENIIAEKTDKLEVFSAAMRALRIESSAGLDMAAGPV